METFKKHLLISGPDGLHELKKIATRFEEKIYVAAMSQSDYVRKISLKLLTMENKVQNTVMPNSDKSTTSQNPVDLDPIPENPGTPTQDNNITKPSKTERLLASVMAEVFGIEEFFSSDDYEGSQAASDSIHPSAVFSRPCDNLAEMNLDPTAFLGSISASCRSGTKRRLDGNAQASSTLKDDRAKTSRTEVYVPAPSANPSYSGIFNRTLKDPFLPSELEAVVVSIKGSDDYYPLMMRGMMQASDDYKARVKQLEDELQVSKFEYAVSTGKMYKALEDANAARKESNDLKRELYSLRVGHAHAIANAEAHTKTNFEKVWMPVLEKMCVTVDKYEHCPYIGMFEGLAAVARHPNPPVNDTTAAQAE
ncbi:hypothetical protein GIB67_016964 [Kingdonia uniflora]|uniref:Mediator complex subunit 15 KIX domain-containing protein n=1 Tax=Kingdonia uniflora TaxID=39325 RepID=A0A7J7M3K4_9MAGN|nr:hypothetical protein GIB67_016964 [Kingdonia uniflora]